MKFLFSILAFPVLFVSTAYAADYGATLTYCNSIPSDASTCPSSSSWQGVILKDLKLVILPVSSVDYLIQLEDSFGNTWTRSLETCKSKLSDLRGCLAKVDLTNPKQTQIHISIWDIRKPQRDLAFFIDNQNQLSLLTDDGNHLIFSLTGK